MKKQKKISKKAETVRLRIKANQETIKNLIGAVNFYRLENSALRTKLASYEPVKKHYVYKVK